MVMVTASCVHRTLQERHSRPDFLADSLGFLGSLGDLLGFEDEKDLAAAVERCYFGLERARWTTDLRCSPWPAAQQIDSVVALHALLCARGVRVDLGLIRFFFLGLF